MSVSWRWLRNRGWRPTFETPDKAFQEKLSTFNIPSPIGPVRVENVGASRYYQYTQQQLPLVFGKVLKVDAEYQDIKIHCERALIEVLSSDDSCGGNDSHADAEFILGSPADLIGLEVLSVGTFLDDKIDAFYPNREYADSAYCEYQLHVLRLANDKTVHIMGSHCSNGYYSGGSYMQVTRTDPPQTAATTDGDVGSASVGAPDALFEFDSLGKVLKVDAEYQDIKIHCERALIEVLSSDDSCGGNDSHADAEFILGSPADLIGLEVLSVGTFLDDKIDAFYPNREYADSAYCEYQLHVLRLANDKTVHIMGSHCSNGYYSGGSYMEVTRIDPPQAAEAGDEAGAAGAATNGDVESPIACAGGEEGGKNRSADARVIFFVGLPGSGKTTFCEENLDPKDFYIMDDSCSDPEHRLILEAMMNNGLCVAFGDPRLCELKRLRSLVSLALPLVVSPAQIGVVYFDNDKEKCALNVDARNVRNEEDRLRFRADVELFHPRYEETIAFIESPALDERIFRHRVGVFQPKPL